METIIAAALSAAAAIVVCMINNNKLISMVVYRLEQLEKKQERYNNVISRTYELEKNEALITEEIRVANHRIDDLEQFHKP